MSIELTISKINNELISAVALLDSWFDRPESFLQTKWPEQISPADVLNYVVHYNQHFINLLDKKDWVTLDAVAEKFLSPHANIHSLDEYIRNVCLELEAGNYNRNSDTKSLDKMRSELRAQLHYFLCYLDTFQLQDDIFAVNHHLARYVFSISLHIKKQAILLEKTFCLVY